MTIPVNAIVAVNPGVLPAGGGSLDLLGLVLTTNTRLPSATVMPFTSPATVGAYFGLNSSEYAEAEVYFAGFNNSIKKPSTLYFTLYPNTSVGAFLRGGNVSGLTIPQLQAISGTLTVLVDGYSFTNASVNLSADNSFSAAATTIATALNSSLPTGSSFTAAIAAGSATITGSIAGNVMYVTAVTGTVYPGAVLAGTGITSGTQVADQLSGTVGGIGTYAVTKAPAAPVASESITATYGTMTVSAVASGTLALGQLVAGSTTAAGTIITALGTGAGLTGTYIVNLTQTVGSASLTTTGLTILVTYDSLSGGFLIQSGNVGAYSTIAYATGTIAGVLGLTAVTGAVLGQGQSSVTPNAFMSAVTVLSQQWSNFMTMFDPDGGSGNTTQRGAFALWTSQQNNRYGYVSYDTSLLPTTTNPATASLGAVIEAAGYSGTNVNWESGNQHLAAFVCSIAASTDFEAPNGRTDPAFRSQSGLIAGVTDPTTASNLLANFYNYYGAYANADNNWTIYYNGSVSGPFEWLDTYWDQIWLNVGFQSDLMTLLTIVGSIPYNQAGYSIIAQALAGRIQTALSSGIIRAGVTLSSSQVQEVNQLAGKNIAPILQSRGWYLSIVDPEPSVRQARGTPVMVFFYCDGESIQQITLASFVLQ